VCFALNPGGVQTDLAARATASGDPAMASVPLKTVGDAAGQMLGRIQGATREKQGGRFIRFDGSEVAW
jgi:hypothetical protein